MRTIRTRIPEVVVAQPVPQPQLDLYDTAYLAGALPRLVDAALVALVETGRVAVRSPGQLAVPEPARRHPVEAAVLDAIGTLGHRSVDTIRWRAAADDRIAAVGRRLREDGLVAGPRRLLRRRAGAPGRTAAGRRALRRLEAESPTDPAADGGSALRVALHGRTAMTDPQLRAAIFQPMRPVPPSPETSRRGQRDAEDRDPTRAAFRSQQALGGAVGLGMVDGMTDGGGF
jgi:hypothetical protein